MGKLEEAAGSPANLSLHHSFSPPSSSIWVAPRATASQRFAKRRRRFSAAAAPLRRPALTAPGRDSSLRPLPSGAGSEPAVLVPGRSSRVSHCLPSHSQGLGSGARGATADSVSSSTPREETAARQLREVTRTAASSNPAVAGTA